MATLLARLADQVGHDYATVHDLELREHPLAALRYLGIANCYITQGAVSLPIRMSPLNGTQGSAVSVAEAPCWASATSSEFRSVEVPGDHMYFAKDWPPPVSHSDQIAHMAPRPARDGIPS